MGLDNIVSKYSKRIYIDSSVRDLFDSTDIHICGYDGTSFRGKTYAAVMETICDVSLYGLLTPYKLKEVVVKLTSFLNQIPKIETDDEIDVRKYFEDYDDTHEEYQYFITIKELCGLREFMRICAENDLYIHADF